MLACCAMVILFAESIGRLTGIESSMVAAGALAGFGMVFFALGRELRCRHCGTSPLFHAMAHARNAHWLDSLYKQSACPKCGRTDDA
jgi:hypothetical protein